MPITSVSGKKRLTSYHQPGTANSGSALALKIITIMRTASLTSWIRFQTRVPPATISETQSRAYDLLRTIWSYAFGSAFVEITWDTTEAGCVVDVRRMLRPDTAPDLAAVADVFCGRSDTDAQFGLGLDLMLSGIDSDPGP